MTTSETALATISHAGQLTAATTMNDLMAALGGDFEVKQVTRTVLQQIENVPFAVTFEALAKDGEVLEAGKGSSVKMQPARTADVVNLLTGELQTLIMNTVLEGELTRNYPDGSYVGRSFAIRGFKPTDGEGKAKRYRVYQIAELVAKKEGAEITSAADVGSTETVADGSDPVNRKGETPKG